MNAARSSERDGSSPSRHPFCITAAPGDKLSIARDGPPIPLISIWSGAKSPKRIERRLQRSPPGSVAHLIGHTCTSYVASAKRLRQKQLRGPFHGYRDKDRNERR